MTVPPVSTRAPQNRTALVLAGGLVLGGVLSALAPVVGVVHTYDGVPAGTSAGALWVSLLPAVLALVLVVRRPLLGTIFAAGAGLVGVARLVIDIGVAVDPDAAIRPELFYETTPRAHPFALGGGLYFLLVGDLVTVVVGLLAARLVFRGLAEESADLPTFGSDRVDSDPPAPGGRVSRQMFVAGGLVGALAVLVGALSIPYSGGYLAGRLLPPTLGLWAVVGGLLVAATGAVAVVLAGGMTRSLGAALLGGVASAVAVPGLVACLVAAGSAPVDLGVGPVITLVGAALLGAAGLLLRPAPAGPAVPGGEDRPPAPALPWVPGVLAVLAGGLALLAARLPELHFDGRADVAADAALPTGYPLSAPIPTWFAFAAILLVVAGVIALIPLTARAGRVAITLVWAPLAVALLHALVLYNTVASTLVDSAALTGITVHVWTLGPGVWTGVLGLVGAVLAAVIAVVVDRRSAQESTVIAEEESRSAHRRVAMPVAIFLSMATLVAAVLPAYATAGGSAATLGFGLGVDSIGSWLLAAAMIGGAWTAALARRPAVALAAALTGAAIGVTRLVIPAAVRATADFHERSGSVATEILCVLFVVAAVAVMMSARRVTTIDLGLMEPPNGPARSPAARGTERIRSGGTAGKMNRSAQSAGSGKGRR